MREAQAAGTGKISGMCRKVEVADGLPEYPLLLIPAASWWSYKMIRLCVCELLFYLPWLKYNESVVATTPPFPLLLPFHFRLNLPLKCGAFSHFISLPLPPPLPLCIVSTFPLWLSSNISTYSRYSCTLSIRQMCHSCCWKGNGQLQTCNICHIQNQSSLNGNGNAGQSGGHTHM